MRSAATQLGLAHIEVLLAALLVALSLVPALDALQAALRSTEGQEQWLMSEARARAAMETLLAEPYPALFAAAADVNDPNAATAYSEPAATPERRRVQLALYDPADADGDGDPFTIDDPNLDGDANPYTGSGIATDLLWARVELEGTVHSFETLVAP